MSMDPPAPRCEECDAELDVDGDDGACYYTGRACEPGGCDCGTTRTTLCDKCEAEDAAVPTVNMPVPFPGTPEERQANFFTHQFFTVNGADYVCGKCDAKSWHVAADYPCGADVPRHDVALGRGPGR